MAQRSRLAAYGEHRRHVGMANIRTKEGRIMKKIFKDHGYESLLPSGEASHDIDRKEENK